MHNIIVRSEVGCFAILISPNPITTVTTVGCCFARPETCHGFPYTQTGTPLLVTTDELSSGTSFHFTRITTSSVYSLYSNLRRQSMTETCVVSDNPPSDVPLRDTPNRSMSAHMAFANNAICPGGYEKNSRCALLYVPTFSEVMTPTPSVPISSA